jgi:F0F1-type ATP synthase assembly protein I
MNYNSVAENMPGLKKELGEQFKNFSKASTIALSIVFSIFAGVLAGYYLDTKVFHEKTYPYLTILFFIFGLAGGIKNFFILSKRFQDEDIDKDKKK